MDHSSVFRRYGCRNQATGRVLGAGARSWARRGTGRGISARTCGRQRGSDTGCAAAGSPPRRRPSWCWRRCQPGVHRGAGADDWGVAGPVGWRCGYRVVVSDTDLAALRDRLEVVPSRISESNTHKTLGGACELLGLPAPPDQGSKYERARKSFEDLPDAELPEVAERCLAHLRLDASTRNAIQDALWAGEDPLPIPKRTRREIARDLDLSGLVHGADRFLALLDRLWVVDDGPFGSLGSLLNPKARPACPD